MIYAHHHKSRLNKKVVSFPSPLALVYINQCIEYLFLVFVSYFQTSRWQWLFFYLYFLFSVWISALFEGRKDNWGKGTLLLDKVLNSPPLLMACSLEHCNLRKKLTMDILGKCFLLFS